MHTSKGSWQYCLKCFLYCVRNLIISQHNRRVDWIESRLECCLINRGQCFVSRTSRAAASISFEPIYCWLRIYIYINLHTQYNSTHIMSMKYALRKLELLYNLYTNYIKSRLQDISSLNKTECEMRIHCSINLI